MTFALTAPPCVILAGGRSSRMGTNKTLVKLGGLTLLAYIVARITPQAGAVALNAAPGWSDDHNLRRVADTLPGQLGPLAGVLAALRDTAIHYPDATHVLTVPTDGPFLPADLLERLAAIDGDPQTIAIASSGGEQHPVVALWPVALADDLEAWLLKDDKRRVRDFQRHYPVAEVIFPLVETTVGPLDPFLNVNTPADLVAAEHWLQVL